MRLCFVYDHCYPHTIGGAERYYHTLTRRLARDHDVTYVTQRWWSGPRSRKDGNVHEVGLMEPRIMITGGRRAIGPTVLFGIRVFFYLLRNAQHFDVVHVSNFPHFALIGARLALRTRRRSKRPWLIGDWHEVWTLGYWQSYLGRVPGTIGYVIQHTAIRASDRVTVFSRLHAGRLEDEGRSSPWLLPEFPPASQDPRRVAEAVRERIILFVGRLIPEKRAHLLIGALSEVRRHDSSWRARVVGEGSEADRIASEAKAEGLSDAVDLPGFVPRSVLEEELLAASVLVLPTQREGFGLVVLEAAASGLPSVLIEGRDNAATELIEEGVNGTVCPDADPATLARAVERLSSIPDVHARTLEWFQGVESRYDVDVAVAELERRWAGLGR